MRMRSQNLNEAAKIKIFTLPQNLVNSRIALEPEF
jgi:hypothetical protein